VRVVFVALVCLLQVQAGLVEWLVCWWWTLGEDWGDMSFIWAAMRTIHCLVQNS